MAQFGEKAWFRKIGEDGVSSFAGRMTQGNFDCHRDGTGVVLCITKNGLFVRQKFDETDTERCLGSEELGRLEWLAVANGGS